MTVKYTVLDGVETERRKVASYLRDWVREQEVIRLLQTATNNRRSKEKGLTGGEAAEATRLKVQIMRQKGWQ